MAMGASIGGKTGGLLFFPRAPLLVPVVKAVVWFNPAFWRALYCALMGRICFYCYVKNGYSKRKKAFVRLEIFVL
jgi:hypothetical protein